VESVIENSVWADYQSLWPRMHTNEHESEIELDAIAESVIGAAYEVSNVLGAGFLGKVYEGDCGCSAGFLFRCPIRGSWWVSIWPTWWWRTDLLLN
jgi:hypothetical protein